MSQVEIPLNLARLQVLAAEERVARRAVAVAELRDRGQTTDDAIRALESDIVRMRRARRELARLRHRYAVAEAGPSSHRLPAPMRAQRNGQPDPDTAGLIGFCVTGLLAMLALSMGLACLLRERPELE